MIAMTCKDLGTEIRVVARAQDQRVASRMLKAGVDNVICPFQLCGQTAANLITT
jgi:Trk K+ transport system NAD-binding subunit